MPQRPSPDELEQRVQELETALAECRRKLEMTQRGTATAQKYLDIAGVIIMAMDDTGKITLINKKGCEILGYPEAEILGKNWFDHFLPERLRENIKSVFLRLLKGEVKPVEYYQNPVLRRDGEERIIAWYNTLITDKSGKISGTLSSGEDVTDRVQAEEALRLANKNLSLFSKELEKMVEKRTSELREKDRQLIEAERFAALGKITNRIAHEFRNPLTVIGGFARRIFESSPEEDPLKRYLRIIMREVEVLEGRVAEIIKIGKEG